MRMGSADAEFNDSTLKVYSWPAEVYDNEVLDYLDIDDLHYPKVATLDFLRYRYI